MTQTILITNGRVIDPSQNMDRITNILIENGRITAYDIQPSGREREIDASGMIVAPGLVDLHVHLREPGGEDAETISSGTEAAINGGYTSIACMPNTTPPTDTQAAVEYIKAQAARADRCNVYPVACISKNREGKELSEMGQLAAAGAVGFTDDGSCVSNAELMRRALEYAKMFDLPVMSHAEDEHLSLQGVMHEGLTSVRLGLRGIPSAAEDVITGRDIILSEYTHGRLHLMHVSTKTSVALIRNAKLHGVPVTAEVTPHHLTLTDDLLESYDTNLKMNPPLRDKSDVAACIQGLLDGTLDCISTDHAPHAREKKEREFDFAPFGVTGLETALGVISTYLVKPGILTWNQVIEKMSFNPAKIIRIPKGTLALGADADVVMIDPNCSWKVTKEEFRSQSVNSAYLNKELIGRAMIVIVGGRVRLNRRG
ncbi:MAG: dihydroorotase [Planctomycetia bacterium]|nr:dihydroorotase [Planctomycetia bacterium]